MACDLRRASILLTLLVRVSALHMVAPEVSATNAQDTAILWSAPSNTTDSLGALYDVYFDPDNFSVQEIRNAVTQRPVSRPLTRMSMPSPLQKLASAGGTVAAKKSDFRRKLDFTMVFLSSTNNFQGFERTWSLEAQCSELGLQCYRLFPRNGHKLYGLAQTAIAGLRLFRNTPGEFAMYTEDDTHFIDNIKSELAESVMDLPNGWEVFHLCPGYLHKRTDQTHTFSLNLEAPLDGHPEKSKLGRVYLDWPRGSTPVNKRGVLGGGPVSMLFTKAGAATLETALLKNINSWPQWDTTPTDIVFRDVGVQHPGKHFVARQPQLCKESMDNKGRLLSSKDA